jgi:hypothetical protein
MRIAEGREGDSGGFNGGGSRARPPIIQYSIYLVCFMISSLQAGFFPPD